MDGLLVVDKPAGPTSHDVVARMRRVLGERRIGHTGTLDPAATGVLPLVLGRATRLARFLSARDKSYDAVVRLGVATDTYDARGAAVGAPYHGPWPSRDEVAAALERFRGTFAQQPPAFSAKKVEGVRSYKLARAATRQSQLSSTGAGAPPPSQTDADASPQTAQHGRWRFLAPVSVTVRAIDIVGVDGDCVTLAIDCSAGFYMRSLAHDLGEALGTGAHLAELRRTRSGDFTLADALPLATAEHDRDAARAAVIPLERMLLGLSAVVLTEEGTRRAARGRDLGAADMAGSPIAGATVCRLLNPSGALVGIGEPTEAPGLLHPSVVLV
jgi:tRNA pseudouridine55 synthase